MLELLEAGLGKPEKPSGIWLNASRLTTSLTCRELWRLKYKVGIEADWPKGTALTIGSLVHLTLELMDTKYRWGNKEDMERLFDEVIFPGLESAIDEAERAGHRNKVKDLKKQYEFLPHMLEAYTKRYDGPATGKSLYVEQDIWSRWLLDKDIVTILSRVDRISESNGAIYNGEIKTTADSTYLPAMYVHRYWSPQNVICNLGLKEIFRDRYAGVIHDVIRKRDWPLKASKNGSVEERREQWPVGMFETFTLPFRKKDEEDALELLEEWLTHYVRAGTERNPRACMQFARPDCEMFAQCYGPDDGWVSHFRNREPDYVDEAKEAFYG